MNSTNSSQKLSASVGKAETSFLATYDLICVGFGPAQIATAIANRESQRPSKALFLEKKPSFSWKPSGHLPRTRMENAFVYDLATTRNPRSAFTYPSYLLARNRLIAFANSDRLQPLREEFEDYLRWCAEQFSEQVRYGYEVVSVTPDRSTSMVKSWQVTVRDANGLTQTLRARNIITPSPARQDKKTWPLTGVNFEDGQRIISFEDYLTRRNQLREPREPRLEIVVIGSSSKTIEVVDDLLKCPRLGNVTVITDNEELTPLRLLGDDSAPVQPRLCSIWAKPSCDEPSSILDAPELVQSIYGHAYEKRVASKGQYTLRIVAASNARDSVELPAQASIIIAENTPEARLSMEGLFEKLDTLVLGCRQKGESLDEVLFKRGTVAEGCHMWMLSNHSNGGQSLAKDVAVRAGDISRVLAATTADREAHVEERDGRSGASDRAIVISARI